MVSSAGLEERKDPQISQITQIKEAAAASTCVGFPTFRTGKMRLRSVLIAALTQLMRCPDLDGSEDVKPGPKGHGNIAQALAWVGVTPQQR
jgi:hypothetical protein